MDRKELDLIIEYLKHEYLGEATGHDWYHLDRVRKQALRIAREEQVSCTYIIELASLLHDVPDEKFVEEMEGKKKLDHILSRLSLTESEKSQLKSIIYSISYKGGHEAELTSIEAKIVRDADRLDALGAIGIARTFAYGGRKGRSIYNPDVEERTNMSIEEYRNGDSSSIHHFYEKLLKLKDLMCTETGKALAEERHDFLLRFLEQFNREWTGQE
ncbi:MULTISPECIES: HD domain-containing protein [Bacillaceae]|uniref:HD domain-containing protein n=1 Tax=Bacillaceae TaxID=186817 RepID=UPI001C5A4C43|nr:HD domain-containing protein [Rossellomorea sp. YZS02]MBW3113234.1 HD domain-containing protein [Bacillus sp. MCCB 382]MDX8343835.1 HD domain-containing protein [Rossellomorea sp. YZS02]